MAKCILILMMLTLILDVQVAANSAGSNKLISDINALLPISHCDNCRQAKHLVQVFNGCYHW